MPRWIFKGRDRLTHLQAEQLDRAARDLELQLASRTAVLHLMRINRIERTA